jgi:hypothetical protein
MKKGSKRATPLERTTNVWEAHTFRMLGILGVLAFGLSLAIFGF